jgi:cation diffusion facilitator family transporter
VAAFLEGLFILGSALYIAREASLEFGRPEPLAGDDLGWALAAMAFSLAVTAALVVYLGRKSRESRSVVLEADTVHYRMDLITNGSVLLALGLVALTGWDWLDPAIALVISLVVARAALPVLRKGLDVLLDRALDESLVERIRAVAEGHSPRVNGVHEMKSRRAGDTHFVEFHLVFDEDIRLLEAHRVADEIEARIRALEPGRWIINIHLDPVDDSHRDRKLAKREPGG